jgi:hypothetical protein
MPANSSEEVQGNLAGPPKAVLERQWWADAPVNGGHYPFDGTLDATLTGRAAVWPEGSPMRTRYTVEVRINVAACLFGIAAIIKALM